MLGQVNFWASFIKPEVIDKKYGRWFTKIESARLEADYEARAKFTKTEAEEALNAASDFVRMAEKLLPNLLK